MTKQKFRTAGKWGIRFILFLLVLVALDVAILAFPRPLFAHKQVFGEFTVYSRQPVPAGFERVIDGARTRIQAMENARPGNHCRVFICNDQQLYSVFAVLTRRSSNSMAIGLSLLGNIFMNEEKIRRVAAHNYRNIRHSRFEGDFGEVIAHEIAHFNVVNALGFRSAIKMPVWKSEGYAEYQANLAATRADSSYDFTERIDLLMDLAFWGGGDSVARRLFEWHLLVEFLSEVEGFRLNDLVDEAVTEASARRAMLEWYEAQL